MKKHKEKWHFRFTNDWTISLKYPKMINVDLFSFHMEEDVVWVSFFGFSIVAERY